MRKGVLPVLALCLFLTAGLYKLEPVFKSLPDLTVVFAAMTLLSCALVMHRTLEVPRFTGLVVVFFASLLPGMFEMGTSYGTTKVTQTFTLGLLACVAPLFLLRRDGHFKLLLWLLTVVGGILAILSISGYNNSSELGRFSALETTTISEARIVGLALIWIALLTVEGRRHRVVGLVAVSILTYAMVGTGSRGPLVALLAAMVAVVLFTRGTQGKRLLSTGQIGFVIVLGGLLYLAFLTAPVYSRFRLLTIGDSGSARLIAWRATLEAIPTHPLGIGWGNWSTFFGPSVTQGDLLYPHNVVLEVFLEGGWIAGLAVFAFLVYVGRRAVLQSTDLVGRVILALWIYYVINSLVSDDLLGARVMLAMCGVALARYSLRCRGVRDGPVSTPEVKRHQARVAMHRPAIAGP